MPDIAVPGVKEDAVAFADLIDPFVFVMALGDFSITYQAAGFLEDVKYLISAESALRESMLDSLHRAGIEIVSPTFMNQRQLDQERVFIPRPSLARKDVTSSPGDSRPEELMFDKAEKAESDAKVEHLGLPSLIHEDVRRLQIPVKHGFLVRVLDRLADLHEQAQSCAFSQLLPLGVVTKRHAIDEFHREEWAEQALNLDRSRFEDAGDSHVVETAEDASLLVESPAAFLAEHPGARHLESDTPGGVLLFGLVDDAHASAGDHPLDLVAFDPGEGRAVVVIGSASQSGGRRTVTERLFALNQLRLLERRRLGRPRQGWD